MYFKITRKILKKALVWLKKQNDFVTVIESITDINGGTKKNVKKIPNLDKTKYIEQAEFALYKTKLNEFYIDYDFALAIRPALLTKEIKNDTSRRPS